jgi:hypothetical protein
VIKYARLCNGYGEIKSPTIMVYGAVFIPVNGKESL